MNHRTSFKVAASLAFPLVCAMGAALGACSSSSTSPGTSFDGGAQNDSGTNASDSGNGGDSATNDAGEGGLPVVACTTAGAFNWARAAGGANSAAVANSVAVDAQGNSYIAGTFVGAATFGAFALTELDTTNGSVFVAKLDPNGNYLWAKAFGAEGNDTGLGIGLDSSGDVFVVGSYHSTVNFGGKMLTSSTTGASSFILRMTPESGDVVWAASTGTTGNVTATFIDVDTAGNSFIGGSFTGTVMLSSTITITDTDPTPNAFIERLDANGNALLAMTATGSGAFVGAGIDSSGNVYGAGNIDATGSVTFPGPTTLTGGGTFVVKYDSTGNVLFAKQGNGTLAFTSFAMDTNANTYAAGHFTGTADFNGLDVTSVGGGPNSVLVSYDSTGNPAWAEIGSAAAGQVFAEGLAFDGTSGLYLTGTTSATATFGAATVAASATGNFFAVKYDLTGTVKYAASTSATGVNTGIGVAALSSSGGLYIVGQLEADSTFGAFPVAAGTTGGAWVGRICN